VHIAEAHFHLPFIIQVVEIQDSFGVPHRETDEGLALGQDYHRIMYNLFSRINDKEKIVGW
jgi:hypothetical protein